MWHTLPSGRRTVGAASQPTERRFEATCRHPGAYGRFASSGSVVPLYSAVRMSLRWSGDSWLSGEPLEPPSPLRTAATDGCTMAISGVGNGCIGRPLAIGTGFDGFWCVLLASGVFLCGLVPSGVFW